MIRFRAYYMQGEQIVFPQEFEEADDAAAMVKAGELLSDSRFPRIEVWQGTRLVGAVAAPVEHQQPTTTVGDLGSIAGDRASSALPDSGSVDAENHASHQPKY